MAQPTLNELQELMAGLLSGAVKPEDILVDGGYETGSHPLGSLAPFGQKFCPFTAIKDYPKRLNLDRQTAKVIEDRCFGKDLFWSFHWDIFYLYPQSAPFKAILLVPKDMVDEFLKRANENLAAVGLTLPDMDGTLNPVALFNYFHRSLQPRFLGCCTSRRIFRKLHQKWVPCRSYQPANELQSDIAYEAEEHEHFGKIFDLLKVSCDSPRPAAQDMLNRKKALVKLDRSRTLNHAQRLLGQRATRESDQHNLPPLIALSKLDPCKHPHVPDSVIVSVDVECWEEDNSKVTEVGISAFEVYNALSTPPGTGASAWYDLIKSYHYRIFENMHLRNGKYVSGRPDDFRFGDTKVVRQAEIVEILKEHFKWPRCCGRCRAVTLIGHDLKQDLSRLATLGLELENLPNKFPGWPTLDTQTLYQYINGGSKLSLAKVLEALDILPFGLHNAGNDARYTLQAFLSMVFQSVAE